MILRPSLLALLATAAVALDSPAPPPAKPDAEGYLRDWLVLEPAYIGAAAIGDDERLLRPVFDRNPLARVPVQPEAGQSMAIGSERLAWSAVHGDQREVKLPAKEQSLIVAVTYVRCERDLTGVTLSVGSDDGACWRVNGKEVLRRYTGGSVKADSGRSNAFKLKAGINRISAEVVNEGGGSGLCARLFDKRDQPITDVAVTLVPR